MFVTLLTALFRSKEEVGTYLLFTKISIVFGHLKFLFFQILNYRIFWTFKKSSVFCE